MELPKCSHTPRGDTFELSNNLPKRRRVNVATLWCWTMRRFYTYCCSVVPRRLYFKFKAYNDDQVWTLYNQVWNFWHSRFRHRVLRYGEAYEQLFCASQVVKIWALRPPKLDPWWVSKVYTITKSERHESRGGFDSDSLGLSSSSSFITLLPCTPYSTSGIRLSMNSLSLPTNVTVLRAFPHLG